MSDEQLLFINGEFKKSEHKEPVIDKYSRETVSYVYFAGEKEVKEAVDAAKKQYKIDKLPPFKRYEILLKAAEITKGRKKQIAKIMVSEAGMTFKDAMGEIERAIHTLVISAEEAKRITGEVLPVKANPGMEKRVAFTQKIPKGVVCAITPFNAPFSNVIHKLAPAIAAGNTVVLKPASITPQSALAVLDIMIEAGMPPKHVNVVFGEVETGTYLLENKDINFYTFTGSTRVGEIIKTKSGLRNVSLELGNNSATIVTPNADIKFAAPIITKASFRKAGQVCVSLQRIYAHASIIDNLADELKLLINNLKVGDPMNPETDVGPVINDDKIEQIKDWIQEAVHSGAEVMTGNKVEGSIFYPTLIKNASQNMKVVCNEIFGPVLSLVPYKDLDEAIRLVNDSEYGLQAGVFTTDINEAMKVAQEIEAGGVNINETSNTRFDAMPYGGVKNSGIGREGPKYAIESMTDTKIIHMNLY
ncbi:aldehyde dehydrogenase family protein [Alkalihalobacillus oceani]|uniref:aldehyde dehydrogenase family protein n=1 Tax=Halalkalibacter oceani TaxID=1653776 RepID=UPI00204116DE|nr:aldehyde dehydrogenase family protein [Halalkalibacter oceani]MCM3761340.1 aldehyde dehydrogenase family protein [Halalkalibacter oceani]